MATANKEFVKKESRELKHELTAIQNLFMHGGIDWETYLLLKIKAYRDFYKQINIHIK